MLGRTFSRIFLNISISIRLLAFTDMSLGFIPISNLLGTLLQLKPVSSMCVQVQPSSLL